MKNTKLKEWLNLHFSSILLYSPLVVSGGEILMERYIKSVSVKNTPLFSSINLVAIKKKYSSGLYNRYRPVEEYLCRGEKNLII